jgi:hypothetical protein
MSSFFVKPLASLMALITASVPEFTNRTLSICEKISTISFAKSVSRVVGAPKLRPFFTALITEDSISLSQ